MLIGYARVSTQDQNLDLQIDALKKVGCTKIYSDKLSGATTDRPELNKALKALKPGDTLVVWKLDRLGRSLGHLIETVSELAAQGIGFKTVQDNLDTTTNSGKLIFHIFGALAEFERGLIKERVLAGLEAARSRGRVGGRRKSLSEKQLKMARKLLASGKESKEDVARALGVSYVTLWRALKLEEVG